MADGRSSFPGGLAYSGNAYAYAYAYAYSTNAYAYSAPGDQSGIGGFAGDPMLGAAVTATRDALLSEVSIEPLGQDGDRRAGIPFSGAPDATSLPTVNHAPDIHVYGSQVRASLALFELQSSVSFRVDGEKAVLDGTFVDAKGAGNRFGDGARISCQYRHLQPTLVQTSNCLERLRANGIRNREHRQDLSVFNQIRRGLTICCCRPRGQTKSFGRLDRQLL